MDQGGEAGGEHDSFFLSPFPRQRGAAGTEPTGLQSGQFLRRLALPRRIENWSLTSLQQRIVKTGGIGETWALLLVSLGEGHLNRLGFGAMLGRTALLAVPPG